MELNGCLHPRQACGSGIAEIHRADAQLKIAEHSRYSSRSLSVVNELKTFLKSKNADAFNSLLEAGDNPTALHDPDVPSALHRSLLSTNAIKNSFLNTRRKIARVTRFRAET